MAKKSNGRTRSPEEKLRGLVTLKILTESYYTQKELAEKLGISTRTLRRFKNQKGWKLSPKSVAKIKPALNRLDLSIKRLISKGVVIKTKVIRIKSGKKKRVGYFDKMPGLKLPKSAVLQLPVIYESKSGETQTLAMNMEGWTTEQKIAFMVSAYNSERYTSWHAKIKVPSGVSRSGRKGESEELEEEEAEEGQGYQVPAKPPVEYHMIGPFNMRKDTRDLAKQHFKKEIHFHEDAGRVVVVINLVEPLKGKE